MRRSGALFLFTVNTDPCGQLVITGPSVCAKVGPCDRPTVVFLFAGRHCY